jgi:hypothetical protein
LYKDVQSYRLITVAVLVDRMKINGSVARRCLVDLEEKGMIKKVVAHSKLSIYSMFSALDVILRQTDSNKQQLVQLPLQTSRGYESIPGVLRCHDIFALTGG